MITKTSIKCPTLSEFKNYTEWISDKEVKVVEPNPEAVTPKKKREKKELVKDSDKPPV